LIRRVITSIAIGVPAAFLVLITGCTFQIEDRVWEPLFVQSLYVGESVGEIERAIRRAGHEPNLARTPAQNDIWVEFGTFATFCSSAGVRIIINLDRYDRIKSWSRSEMNDGC
jgi:hypothetical protein